MSAGSLCVLGQEWETYLLWVLQQNQGKPLSQEGFEAFAEEGE